MDDTLVATPDPDFGPGPLPHEPPREDPGYIGEKVDPEPNEVYTLAAQVTPAPDAEPTPSEPPAEPVAEGDQPQEG